MKAFHALQLEGMPVEQAAALAGETVERTKNWLNHNGYRWGGRYGDGVIESRVRCALTIEAEIADRVAAAGPSAPCWRCGAARGCEHR